MNPGQHILDVVIDDLDSAIGSGEDLHDLIVKLDSAVLVTYRLEYHTRSLSYSTGSKSAYIQIDRQQLSWKYQFISSTNVQRDKSHLNWKFWLDNDGTKEGPSRN